MAGGIHDTPDEVWDRIQQHAVEQSGLDMDSQLRDRSVSLRDGTQHLREENENLVHEIDIKDRQAMRLRNDKNAAANKAAMLESVVLQLQEENSDLHYRHVNAISDMQKLDASLHDQTNALQQYRNQELTRLRDSVGKSVRSPMRDNTHKNAHSIPRAQRNTRSAEKQAKLLEKKNHKIEELSTELSAISEENNVLRKQNTAMEEELRKCNAEKDSYAQLLLSTPSGVPGGACTSVEVSIALLAEVRSRILTQTDTMSGSFTKVHTSLEGITSMWGVGGVDHIPAGSIINSSVDDMQRFIETEQARLSTLQKLLSQF